MGGKVFRAPECLTRGDASHGSIPATAAAAWPGEGTFPTNPNAPLA
jgi:hypothetical protein